MIKLIYNIESPINLMIFSSNTYPNKYRLFFVSIIYIPSTSTADAISKTIQSAKVDSFTFFIIYLAVTQDR